MLFHKKACMVRRLFYTEGAFGMMFARVNQCGIWTEPEEP